MGTSVFQSPFLSFKVLGTPTNKKAREGTQTSFPTNFTLKKAAQLPTACPYYTIPKGQVEDQARES